MCYKFLYFYTYKDVNSNKYFACIRYTILLRTHARMHARTHARTEFFDQYIYIAIPEGTDKFLSNEMKILKF